MALQAGKMATSKNGTEEEAGDTFKGSISSLLKFFYINEVPSYGNNFFFTIGVYLIELFGILAITGMIMLIFGPYWWDLTTWGTFVRSIHLWAAEAFVTLILIHFTVQLFTSAYRKKKIVWMIGVILLLLVFLEYAFGIGLRGDFVSQWNDKAGADLWNGMGLGYWVNPLNNGALLGWHVAIVPMLLIVLIFAHYMMVKSKGLNTPYRSDIPYTIVSANHKAMYRRMTYIFAIVMLFAIFLRAPYVPPLTIQSIANSSPSIMATTLLNELNQSSHTSTYLDTIDPYTFNTSEVYVSIPYEEYVKSYPGQKDWLSSYYAMNATQRSIELSSAYGFFDDNWTFANAFNSTNPLIETVASLVKSAQAGTYQQLLQGEAASGLDYTYVIRFLSDSRVLQSTARAYGLRTSQLGMIKAGGMWWQIGSYWVLPYNLLEIITAGIPWWGDLENGTLAIIVFAIFLFLPYIPYVRDIPDKLHLYKVFWNRYTVPEMKKGKK
ncbi:MAG: cytochrome b N-terminal domain-containing protein [Candidatus Micrarchaeia archaeon]